MGINLVTFAAQTVTPQDDALIYETALQESGMIYGGTVTIKSANVLHIAAGHGALCGRKFTIEETDVAVGLAPSGSLLGRIYIHMDLSDTGEPISFQTETANSLTPVIQQSDVNINNGVYEINLATFTVDTSTISNLVNVAPFIDISPDSEFSASSNNPLMNKAITKAIGDPETIGGSASQPYTKGALLLATDGQIYEVTQNIALHGSIVNGGNVSPTGNIISQISNIRLKLLWSNSNPSSSFASQNIALSSSDYDLLLINFATGVTFTTVGTKSVICAKGNNAYLDFIIANTSNSVTVADRLITYSNDTSYTANDCYVQTNGSSRSTTNTYCVPVAIYGLKI